MKSYVPFALLALVGIGEMAFAAETRPTIRFYRQDEDWRALCAHPELRTTFYDGLKCLTLADELTLSMGGELRERVESSVHPAFGLKGEGDSYVLQRYLLHSDLRYGDHLRVFAQLGYYDESGRKTGPLSTDVNHGDWQQAFIDVAGDWSGAHYQLREGRQELAFGSSRLVSVRESPNGRRSFHATRLDGRWTEARVTAFYARPVLIKPGSFDDDTAAGERLWGVYGTRASKASLKADIYYFDFAKEEVRYAAGSGAEHRRTVGLRLFGQRAPWDWDVELAYQGGDFDHGDIAAWTVASNVGFRWDGGYAPRLGVKLDIASGDRDAADRRLETFNAMYPKLPYFSEANLVAPANVIDLHPSVSFVPVSNWTLGVSLDALWRQTTADAVYATPMAPYAGTAGRPGRYTGSQAILDLLWQPNDNLEVSSQWVHFSPGSMLREVGGRSGNFAMLSLAVKF